MKKFYKYAGIVAGLSFAIGILFIIIGGIMGAKGIIALSKENGIEIIKDIDVWQHKDMDMEAFESLYIDTKNADVDIMRSKDGKYGVDISLMGDDSSIELENKDGVLTLKDKSSQVGFIINLDIFSWGLANDNKVIIYVPEGAQFRNVELKCDEGDIDVDGVENAEVLNITAAAGDVDVNGGAYQNIKLNVNVGDVTLENVKVSSALNVGMDVGDLDVIGDLEANIDITLNVGDINIETGVEASNYKYDIKASVGEIDVFGHKEEGLDGEMSGNHNGKYTMNIHNDLGSVTVK